MRTTGINYIVGMIREDVNLKGDSIIGSSLITDIVKFHKKQNMYKEL